MLLSVPKIREYRPSSERIGLQFVDPPLSGSVSTSVRTLEQEDRASDTAGCLVEFTASVGNQPDERDLMVSANLEPGWNDGISAISMSFCWDMRIKHAYKDINFEKNKSTLSFSSNSIRECEFVGKRMKFNVFQQHLLSKKVTLELTAFLDESLLRRLGRVDSLSSSLAARLKLDVDHLSDIDVVAGDRVFHCHKVIMASRSDVFEAMLSHGNVEECQEGKIVLDNDPDVAMLFLKFIYTDQFPGVLDEDKAVQVLMMADKYNVPKMKRTCSKFLAECITIENCSSILIAGRRGNSQILENKCCAFIVKNIDTVKKTEGWREMVETLSEFSILASLSEHM
jgi:hypothetical protein